jgi:hypothetical protein
MLYGFVDVTSLIPAVQVGDLRQQDNAYFGEAEHGFRLKSNMVSGGR